MSSPVSPLLFGIFPVPDANGREDLIAQVETADRLGFDLVGIQDHPYQSTYLETWTLLSYLAARTQHIRLLPDVANLPLRPSATLAKAAATLDLLSGGRVELGVGAGAAYGGPRLTPGESVSALQEAITVMRRLWSSERAVSYDGRFHSLHGARPGPAPAHPIGIWVGAYRPRMLELTGRLADGWLPSLPRLPLNQLAGAQNRVDDAAVRAGRDPGDVLRIANVVGALVDGSTGSWLHGPPEHWIEELGQLAEQERMDGFIVWIDAPDALTQTERLAAEVIAPLRAATQRPPHAS